MRPSPYVSREDFDRVKADALTACTALALASDHLIAATLEIERLRAELLELRAERPAWYTPEAEA